jgi:hypothetical protein
MRSLPSYLNQDALALAWLITVTMRNGSVQRFTTAQQNVTIGALTWNAEPGVEVSKVEYNSDGSVANAEINIATRSGGPVAALDVKRGKYNGASVLIHVVNLL